MTRQAPPSERLTWAVSCLDVQPADRLLEIGCGHGVAVSLVCDRLDGGQIVAIDRSSKMIAAAKARNAAYVAAGKASFVQASAADAHFGDRRFDKVFALHVPVFLRGDPAREMAAVRRCLAPGGRLYLLSQPLRSSAVRAMAERLKHVISASGFEVQQIRIDPLGAAPGVCAVAAAR